MHIKLLLSHFSVTQVIPFSGSPPVRVPLWGTVNGEQISVGLLVPAEVREQVQELAVQRAEDLHRRLDAGEHLRFYASMRRVHRSPY